MAHSWRKAALERQMVREDLEFGGARRNRTDDLFNAIAFKLLISKRY
jgi:hypothetical protein